MGNVVETFGKVIISKHEGRKPTGIVGCYEYTVNQDAASVAANTTGLESFTIPGVLAGEHVIGIVPPALVAGIGLGQPYVSADNTIIVPLINTTAGALDVLVGDWKFLVMSAEDI